MAWTNESIEALRKHCDGRFTASEVVNLLANDGITITRNAVIGKVHRLRNNGDEKIRLSTLATGRHNYSNAWGAAKVGRKVKPKATPKPVKEAKPKKVKPEGGHFAAGEGVKLQDVKAGQCRWPLGEGENFCYCGKDAPGRKPYCNHHASVAYEDKTYTASKHYNHIRMLEKRVSVKLPGEGL